MWAFTALLFATSLGLSDVCIDPELFVVEMAPSSVSDSAPFYLTCDAVGPHAVAEAHIHTLTHTHTHTYTLTHTHTYTHWSRFDQTWLQFLPARDQSMTVTSL